MPLHCARSSAKSFAFSNLRREEILPGGIGLADCRGVVLEIVLVGEGVREMGNLICCYADGDSGGRIGRGNLLRWE